MTDKARCAELIDRLAREHHLDRAEWVELLGALGAPHENGSTLPPDPHDVAASQPATDSPETAVFRADLAARARTIARATFGNRIYVRGLIEFTSCCRNDCYYCGLRVSNRCAARYRLSPEDILACCRKGHALGFRTFVLQGGEDPGWPGGPGGCDTGPASTNLSPADQALCRLIERIKSEFPDCALTLSVGERDRSTYQAWFDAGADRYLLRHETAEHEHYAMLHPPGMSGARRRQCLYDLKEIGYQVGAGFMVGSPGQTAETLAEDFLFLEQLQPQMVGIGPFVPHHDTPFAEHPGGTAELTCACLSMLRLMLPEVLLPSTTALGTIDEAGREKGILAGANVVMPNLSPVSVRKKYELYDNKICTGEEAAECRGCLEGRMNMIGYELATDRGDHPGFGPQ